MLKERNSNSNSEETAIERSNSAKMFLRKNKACPICDAKKFEEDQGIQPNIDYKNPLFLKRFISEGGRMLPSRITNVCAKHQRELKKAIKLSRIIALLPFVFKINK